VLAFPSSLLLFPRFHTDVLLLRFSP
jgi:hypothetical protein